jgi:hypothetical protein
MSAVGWSILYRGPLSSCNYACDYCPFAKTHNTAAELLDDEARLRRFIDWVAGRPEQIGVLFTPWGEALLHRYYQRALCELSHLPNIRRVAIQTNLSCRLDWLGRANPDTLALWCTFHPTQTTMEAFLAQCCRLDDQEIRYSVGIVGTRENLSHLEELYGELRPEIYLWVNALKKVPDYYSQAEIDFISGIDPLFPINNRQHPSLNRACLTGHTVFTVDGNGDMRRCHFVKTVIGNIYEAGFEQSLRPRLCPAETCGCHIGYVHLEELGLDRVYGDGLLERIPQR